MTELLARVWRSSVARVWRKAGRDRLGGMRLRRFLLISLGSVLFVLLVIILIQSGLGVDSDVTITDSNRPEIVGD